MPGRSFGVPGGSFGFAQNSNPLKNYKKIGKSFGN